MKITKKNYCKERLCN